MAGDLESDGADGPRDDASDATSRPQPARSVLVSKASTARAALPVALTPPEKQKTVLSPASRPPVTVDVSAPRGDSGELVGKTLGHFSLQEFVGGGGMGSVYRATDQKLGRTVAVKVIAGDRTDEDTLRRFQNEAQSAARLDHPNIARVYYVGEDAGWHYIVFEFIQGTNLRDYVEQRGPLPVDEVISLALQVAEALEHASEREVIHRDIKPSNVLVMPGGKAKVVDMGLARLHHVESTAADLTSSGMTLGTFDYISPEQARDPRDADVRSDIYSLGCTMFFMLTGQPPFPRGTVLQKLLSHNSDPPPDLREFRDDIDQDLLTIIGKMLAKQPTERYQQSAELIGDLILYARRLGMEIGNQGGTIVISRRSQPLTMIEQQLPWAVPLVVLLAAVLLLNRLSGSSEEPGIPEPTLKAPVAVQIPRIPENANSGDNLDRDTGVREPRLPRASARESVSGGSAGARRSDRDSDLESGPSRDAAREGARTASADSIDGSRAGGSVASPPSGSRDVAGEGSSVAIRRVIVADEDPDVGTAVDVLVTKSFAEAVAQLNQTATISEIELAFTGRAYVPPLEIAPAFGRRVTIRASVDHEPVLCFRPDAARLGTVTKPAMIRLGGGRIQWAGVHFEFDLPDLLLQPRESWSLFRVSDLELARWESCTFTIRNAQSDGSVMHPQVSFLELAPPIGPEMMSNAAKSRPIGARAMELDRCLARGQASLLRGDEAVPFRLDWEQGLLLSSERVIDLPGARTMPIGAGEVHLRRVTIANDRELLAVEIRPDVLPFPLDVHLECLQCVLACQANGPLVRFQGGEEISQATGLFRFTGRNNLYDNSPLFCVVQTATGQTQPFFFDQIQENWYNDSGSRHANPWSGSPPQGPRHVQEPESYELGDAQTNPPSGFDSTQLPAFPVPEPMPGNPDEDTSHAIPKPAAVNAEQQ